MLRQSAAQVERRSFALVPGGTRQMVYVPDHLKSSWLGRIAQLVEQLTLNQRVQGSSPCAPTKVKDLVDGKI